MRIILGTVLVLLGLWAGGSQGCAEEAPVAVGHAPLATESAVTVAAAPGGNSHDGCCHIFECQWTVPTAVTVQNAAGSKPESGGKSESSHVSLVASIGAAETFSPVRHGYLWSRGSPGAGTAVFRTVPRRLL